MKERIKRFYQNHKDGCDTAIVGFAALGALFAVHQARGYRIDKVGHWHNDEGAQAIIVRLKNGDTQTFTKKPTAA